MLPYNFLIKGKKNKTE